MNQAMYILMWWPEVSLPKFSSIIKVGGGGAGGGGGGGGGGGKVKKVSVHEYLLSPVTSLQKAQALA